MPLILTFSRQGSASGGPKRTNSDLVAGKSPYNPSASFHTLAFEHHGVSHSALGDRLGWYLS